MFPSSTHDAGNYSCLVENVFGRDEVTYSVTVLSAPAAPTASASAAGPHSILVEWDAAADGGSPVVGHVLLWRRAGADWHEVDVWDTSSHLLTGLHCGHIYQFTVSAVNAVGRGRASSVITANTSGSGGQKSVFTFCVVTSSQFEMNRCSYSLRMGFQKSVKFPSTFYFTFLLVSRIGFDSLETVE